MIAVGAYRNYEVLDNDACIPKESGVGGGIYKVWMRFSKRVKP